MIVAIKRQKQRYSFQIFLFIKVMAKSIIQFFSFVLFLLFQLIELIFVVLQKIVRIVENHIILDKTKIKSRGVCDVLETRVDCDIPLN